MSDDYSVAPRKEVAEHLEKVMFDTAVIITYDRHTSLMSNWWTVSGHPDTWRHEELTEMVWSLTSQTAEILKSERNAPKDRKLKITPTRLASSGLKIGKGFITLFWISFALSEFKRLSITMNLTQALCGGVSWYEAISTVSNKPYAAIVFILGCFTVQVAWDQ